MIGSVFQGRRRQIRALAARVESERRLLQSATRLGRKGLQSKLHGGWALTGCFAGGLLAGRYGTQLLRPLRRLPWLTLAQWTRKVATHT